MSNSIVSDSGVKAYTLQDDGELVSTDNFQPGQRYVFLRVDGEIWLLCYTGLIELDDLRKAIGADVVELADESDLDLVSESMRYLMFPFMIKDRLDRLIDEDADWHTLETFKNESESVLRSEFLNMRWSTWRAGLIFRAYRERWFDLQRKGLFVDESWMRWVEEKSGRKYKTVAAWINAAETWLLNVHNKEWIAQLPVMDYVDDDGEEHPGLLSVDISKAIRATGPARSDALTDRDIRALLDPSVDYERLRHVLRTTPEDEAVEEQEFVDKGSRRHTRVYDEDKSVFGYWFGGKFTIAMVVEDDSDQQTMKWVQEIVKTTGVTVVSEARPLKQEWIPGSRKSAEVKESGGF